LFHIVLFIGSLILKKKYTIGIIPGDGIGRDVVEAAMIVLKSVDDIAETFDLDFVRIDAGDSAVAKYGDPFPQKTLDQIARTDAALFGAAGPGPVIRGFRRGFNLFANVRPIKAMPGTNAMQPEADFIIVRENLEGLFRKIGYIDGDYHVNLRVFTTKRMEQILRFSFELAVKKNLKNVTFTHKAHVLTYTDKPMLQMFYEIAKEYPAVDAWDMTIDACAMQIVRKPEIFDIVVAENANGDILSDVGAATIGGMGLAPAGNIGESMGIFEPIHGTAPKYAGKNVVNPIAAILAGKMMFDYLEETAIALKIERAVKDVLAEGKICTYDLGGTSSTTEVAEAISERLHII
jgi:3-isopropylmalate dehydrogenase